MQTQIGNDIIQSQLFTIVTVDKPFLPLGA